MSQTLTNQGTVTEPITLDEAKKHLRVEWAEEDAQITGLIAVVREHAETIASRYFAQRTADIYLQEWPTGTDKIEIEAFPITGISALQYRTDASPWVTVSNSIYIVSAIGNPATIQPIDAWPTAELYPVDPIRIQCTIGYATCPKPVKQAMLLHLGTLFANRESVAVGTSAVVQAAEVPHGYHALMCNHKGHRNR